MTEEKHCLRCGKTGHRASQCPLPPGDSDYAMEWLDEAEDDMVWAVSWIAIVIAWVIVSYAVFYSWFNK